MASWVFRAAIEFARNERAIVAECDFELRKMRFHVVQSAITNWAECEDDEGTRGEARLELGSVKDRMFMLEEMRMGFSNEVSR
jgi:hypothetical protein